MIDFNVLMVAAIFFLAAFTQSLSGFGLALVSMPLLAPLVGIRMATPLVALVSVFVEAGLLFHYRAALNLRAIWRLVVSAVVGAPLGVILLTKIDERLAMVVLGIVIAGYAVYALADFHLPKLESPVWAFVAGLLAGMLGGAYNTSGPPVIIYGDCRRWPREEFKSNLQGFFIVISATVLVSHVLKGTITPQVLRYGLYSAPALAAGALLGFSSDRWLSPQTFRRIVLILLVIAGIRMMLF